MLGRIARRHLASMASARGIQKCLTSPATACGATREFFSVQRRLNLTNLLYSVQRGPTLSRAARRPLTSSATSRCRLSRLLNNSQYTLLSRLPRIKNRMKDHQLIQVLLDACMRYARLMRAFSFFHGVIAGRNLGVCLGVCVFSAYIHTFKTQTCRFSLKSNFRNFTELSRFVVTMSFC